MVRYGDDAVFLTDHMFIVDFAGKLTVGTVPIDFFAKKHALHRPFVSLSPLYTLLHENATFFILKNYGSRGKDPHGDQQDPLLFPQRIKYAN